MFLSAVSAVPKALSCQAVGRGPFTTDLPDHSWKRAAKDSRLDKLKYLLRGWHIQEP